MSKLADNLREYAKVVEMCEGTPVLPWDCVRERLSVGTTAKATNSKLVMGLLNTEHPVEFAIGIVENQPVFIGDELYDLRLEFKNNSKFIVNSTHENNFESSCCSWNPPKRTFTLNGKELPMPDACNNDLIRCYFHIEHSTKRVRYEWKSLKDRDAVMNALIELLGGDK